MLTSQTDLEYQLALLHDWTKNPQTGRSNSSDAYEELTREVTRLIRDCASDLINGRLDFVARLILSKLAHVHGLALAQLEIEESHDASDGSQPECSGTIHWNGVELSFTTKRPAN